MCIFCKIVKGEIPSQVILENENFLAFNDINPTRKIHVLIISVYMYLFIFYILSLFFRVKLFLLVSLIFNYKYFILLWGIYFYG